MSIGYQISEVLEQITWMGVAFGIVGYFIYREWGRRRESLTMMERMTPEQLADIRRVDAEIEIERKRRSAGNLWFLRLGMAILGGGLGGFLGLIWMEHKMLAGVRVKDDLFVVQFFSLVVLMIGLFIFFEFLIELWLKRVEERRCTGERK